MLILVLITLGEPYDLFGDENFFGHGGGTGDLGRHGEQQGE